MSDNAISKNFGMFVGLLLGASLCALLLAVACETVLSGKLESKFVCLLLLFLIPFAMQWRGLRLLYQRLTADCDHARIVFSCFYLITMAVCLLSYLGLWLVYIKLKSGFALEGQHEWGVTEGWRFLFMCLSVLSLAFVVLLLLLVATMTRAAIEGEPPPARHGGPDGAGRGVSSWTWGWRLDKWTVCDINHLRSGVSQEPYLSLVFFLTVFLGVSYLLGLAYAFHDKSRPYGEPALYMRNLTVPPPAAPPPAPASQPVATFRFESESAVSLQDEPTAAIDAVVAGINTAFKIHAKDAAANTPPADVQEAWVDKSVRVIVTGFADLTAIQSNAPAYQSRQSRARTYQSNYELAEARTVHVKNLILDRLSTADGTDRLRHIAWECVPRPKEVKVGAPPQTSGGRRATEENEDDRIVTVQLQQGFEEPASLLVRQLQANTHSSLNLLDYVYFANYTITTTGYGDIVPTTPYAKFICSFANICEVFFLVVFFNALLSLKRNKVEADMSERVGSMHPKVEGISEQVDALHVKYIVGRNSAPHGPREELAPDGDGRNGQIERSVSETGGME